MEKPNLFRQLESNTNSIVSFNKSIKRLCGIVVYKVVKSNVEIRIYICFFYEIDFSLNSVLFILLSFFTQGSFKYCPSRSSSNDVMSLFAFSSTLIKLLSKIFDTYNLLRYRQFLKCVSRIIRYLYSRSEHRISF